MQNAVMLLKFLAAFPPLQAFKLYGVLRCYNQHKRAHGGTTHSLSYTFPFLHTVIKCSPSMNDIIE